LLDAFSILAIRAMILLYARRSSSLGRNATARVLLFSAETKAAGEEEETRRRSSSKGTTEPMIGAPGLGLPQAVVEAINVVQGVGEWWKQPRPPAVALLLVGILLLLSLRSCCRYARTLTDELVLYLLSSLWIQTRRTAWRSTLSVRWLLFTSWLRERIQQSPYLSAHTRTRSSGLWLAMRPALFPS
jgi:hypothetical protein